MISLLDLSFSHNACLWIKSQDATFYCFREYEYPVGTDLAASRVAVELVVVETLYAVSICKSDHFVSGKVLWTHK